MGCAGHMKAASIMLPTSIALVSAARFLSRQGGDSRHKRRTAVRRNRACLQALPAWTAQAVSLCGAMLAVSIAAAAIRSQAWYPLLHSGLALMAADRRCASLHCGDPGGQHTVPEATWMPAPTKWKHSAVHEA